MGRIQHLLMALSLCAVVQQASALAATEVYAKVAPSVWRVQTYDVDGIPLAFGSGVVIGEDTLVTNCHVLSKAKRVAVRHEKVSIEAKLEMWDVQRDICQLKARGLGAPKVALGDAGKLAVGQEVFAIGNPKGLDLTMSAGLLSSVRRNDSGKIVLLQTSAAISGGSSGGGLFDDQGVLIGLTTLGSVTGDAQNLNFAVPVDWIKELPLRFAKLGKRAASAPVDAVAAPAPAPAPTPAIGPTALEDDTRLPYASQRMRERYRLFLTRPLPRAFAISEGGAWWQAWGSKPSEFSASPDPKERALRGCESVNKGRCFLYAVDNQVVYPPADAASASP
jgi:hypothetical protein